ncbi:hypothetical protein CVIRNUC_011065 [Coccomyxa viridis]|uniref:Uncharacterized protein ycf33 n=1 Tax=Coccomyxa viridis TaxID=1274662 RepID=A0AAV1IP38_9CHLO|nr:hypothetical protein CVIRNUC_011065 [Coccomyxa viridis]
MQCTADLMASSLRSCKLQGRAFKNSCKQKSRRTASSTGVEQLQTGGKACAFQRALLRVGCNASDKTVSSSARSQEGSTAANTAEDKAASLLMALIAAGGLSWFALSSSVSAAEVQDNLPHFHPVAADLGQLAESEDFWSNILRYVSYFFSVLLGTAYTAVKPIGGFLRKPVSAVITIAAVIGLYIFVSSTVNAMLGVNQENVLVLPPLTGSS